MRDSSQVLLMEGDMNILVWKSNMWTELLGISLKQELDSKHSMGADSISENHVSITGQGRWNQDAKRNIAQSTDGLDKKPFAAAVWGMIIFVENKENSVAAIKDTKRVTELRRKHLSCQDAHSGPYLKDLRK